VVGNIIGAVILGILAGYIARALLPGKQHMGFLMTMVLGIAGAVAGFYIFEGLFGWGDTDKFDLGGLPGAIIGAMILLFLYDRFVGFGDSDARDSAAPAAAAGTADAAADDVGRPERRGGGGGGSRRRREP
jgi:uncharacterized membrane protein YeaQ/YmgE (transglycosylase-associated protein family)